MKRACCEGGGRQTDGGREEDLVESKQRSWRIAREGVFFCFLGFSVGSGRAVLNVVDELRDA